MSEQYWVRVSLVTGNWVTCAVPLTQEELEVMHGAASDGTGHVHLPTDLDDNGEISGMVAVIPRHIVAIQFKRWEDQ